MLNWLKRKKHPKFWNEYSHHFKKKINNDIKKVRFIVFDTETTGLDIKKDRILSIGCVSVIGNTMDIATIFEVYLAQDTFNSKTVKIHGILKEGTISKITEEQAIQRFLKYIENAVLVAHHAAFDVAMINEALKRLHLPKLKNRVIDTGVLFKKTTLKKDINKHYSLDELCDIFSIKMHDRHTASGDAYITALLFFKMIANLTKPKKHTVNDLLWKPKKAGLL